MPPSDGHLLSCRPWSVIYCVGQALLENNDFNNFNWSLWGASHIRQAKLIHCNQIQGHIIISTPTLWPPPHPTPTQLLPTPDPTTPTPDLHYSLPPDPTTPDPHHLSLIHQPYHPWQPPAIHPTPDWKIKSQKILTPVQLPFQSCKLPLSYFPICCKSETFKSLYIVILYWSMDLEDLVKSL